MPESVSRSGPGGGGAARVPAGWRLLLATLARLPQGVLSRLTGRLADVRIPVALRSSILGVFANAAGVDLGEAELPVHEYPTLDAFFVRRLREGVREWPTDPAVIASPVDGVVGALGMVHRGRLLQAKGRDYSAAALLDDPTRAEPFDGGSFLTLYLGPRHYHRVHSPATGSIGLVRHVPGALLPVNRPAINHVPDLFPRNERVVCHLGTDAGRIAVVAVGAYNVGRIEVLCDGGWCTNRAGGVAADHRIEPPHTVDRGDEILVFHLGSTIVLLFERDRIRLADGLAAGAPIRLGQPIASRS